MKGFFGGADAVSSDDNGDDDDDDDDGEDDDGAEKESSPDNDAVQVPLSTTPAEKPEMSPNTIKLDTEIKFAGVPPLGVTEKQEARDRSVCPRNSFSRLFMGWFHSYILVGCEL